MDTGLRVLLALFVISLILDFILISGWRKYRVLLQEQEKTGSPIDRPRLLKQAFHVDAINRWDRIVRKFRENARLRAVSLTVLELGILALWAINVGWDYLDLNPRVVPGGHEFGSAIQANYLWSQLLKCGWCAVWNGFEQGGYPALADLQGSMLHPITILTTLLWGVVNGVKVTLVLAFWFAGVAQWWIARELGLGWLPRMWSAGIAIAGGHLAGRMQLGVYGVVLSTAMASLAIAALIRLARTSQLRDAVLLGILTASAIVSGQGYMQFGLIGILPVAAFFLIEKKNTFAGWRNHLIAAGIALLLAAPLLVPLAHFSPNIAKWMDPQFKSVQPLPYLVLNLVIDDPIFFETDLLGKFPYPYLYTLYIGWVPVLLAVFALNRVSTEARKFILFLGFGALVEFLIAGAVLLKPLAGIWPPIAGIRHPPQIAGLAIPLILGLSAFGLDKLISVRWSDFGSIRVQDRKAIWKISLQLIFLVPLVLSLQSCFRFSQVWIGTRYITDDLFKTLEILRTEDMQWVEPPFGEHDYIAPAISMGMKLSPGVLTWNWSGREAPLAVLYAARKGVPPGVVTKIGTYFGLTYYARDNAPYAGVQAGNEFQPCIATGSGGFIEVTCDVQHTGNLIVQENYWSGWQAWVDGTPAELTGDKRLAVSAPAGSHLFTFRYLPWDVPLGLTLFVIGCAVSLRLITHAEVES